MNEDPVALLPELLLLAGAVGGLLAGLFLPQQRQWVVRLVTAAALVGSGVAAAVALAGPDRAVFDDTYRVDVGLGVARLVIVAATLLVVCLSIDEVAGHPRETELYVLLLLAAGGSMLLAGLADLLVLVTAYLLASVPLYPLAAFRKDAAGTEAGLKLYLLGAFLGVLMLTGVVLLFGVGGSTSYAVLRESLATAPGAVVVVGTVALLAGLLFKAGGVPSHFWVPDVAEGASPAVAAFLTTVPKVGGIVAIHRLVATVLPDAPVDVALLVAVLAAASMTLGNLAAFGQDNVRRLLGYSTVSQVGYLLMAAAVAGRSELALRSLLYYLAAYAVTNLGAFAVVAELPAARTVGDYAGLAGRHRWLAFTLVVCLLGLVGTPPTAVFIGKLSVFSAAADGGFGWLVVVAAVNTVASLFYYLRWLAPMFSGKPVEGRLQLAGGWGRVGAYTAGVASLALGLLAGPALVLASGHLLG